MNTVSKLVLALTLATSTLGSVAMADRPGQNGGGQHYGNRGNTYVQQNNYNRGYNGNNYNRNNSYRGYNNYNRGGNGWGYAGAAIAGAIIGGAIVNSYSAPVPQYYAPPPVYYPPQYYNPYAPVAPIYSYPPPFIGN